jgi:hypothetical protein
MITIFAACWLLAGISAEDQATLISNAWGTAETARIETEEVVVQEAVEGRAYHHHAHTAAMAPYFFATFSSGRENEDDVGQQVMFTRSKDLGVTWEQPRCIVTPPMGEFAPAVATATGLHAYLGEESGARRITAYYGLYEYAAAGLEGNVRKPADAAHQNTRQMLVYSEDDGETWSAPVLVAENVVCNLGPRPLASGRLLMPANATFLFTDDPAGLTGWQRTALPGLPANHVDDSAGFAHLYANDRERLGYCEGSFFQTPDGVIHMMLRTNGPALAVTQSTDDGETWSSPRPTGFSDNGSRHQFGALPDGRFFALSTPCPENRGARTPLVIAVSQDGKDFGRHFVIGDAPAHAPRFPGYFKGGRYGYPHLSFLDDTVVVVYSVSKEDAATMRFPLSRLACP